MAGNPRKPTKPAFSPTRFAAYLRCALAYRFAYVDGLRGRFSRAHAYTSLGASLHRAFDQYQREGGAAALSGEDLVLRLRQSWISAGYESAEQEREHLASAEEMARAFHSAEGERKAVTLLTEKVLKVDRGPYILTGRLDRVDQLPDGSLEVVDYKSGRSTLTEEQVRADLGLMAYETLVRAHYPEQRVRVALHALRPNLRVSIERTPEEAREVATSLDALAARILADEAYEPQVVEGCEDCDFRRICPALRAARPGT